MASVIDVSGVIVDDWLRYDRFASQGAAHRVLVTLTDLRKYPRYFERAVFQLGVDLQPDEAIEDIAHWIPRLELVRLNFSAFADGRAFSQARLLRERFSYRGDIRAHGEVVRDQLSFMQRCGINQFGLADGEDTELALEAFADISESYQPELSLPRLDKVVNG